jgi:hypothetical protein
MGIKFSNNASAQLASSINNSVPNIVVQSGQGALFPTLGAGDYFYATLVDVTNNLEIVKVTARTGDSLTVERGQDGSIARSYSAGDLLELRPVAASLADIASLAAPTSPNVVTGNLFPSLYQTNSTTFVSAGETISITPSSADSKILLIASVTVALNTQGYLAFLDFRRGSTLNLSGNSTGIVGSGGIVAQFPNSLIWVDQPNTTSPVSYGVCARTNSSVPNLTIANQVTYSPIIAMEIK